METQAPKTLFQPAQRQTPSAVPVKRELPVVVRKLQEPSMLSEIQTRLPVAVAKSLPPAMIVSLMLDQCRKSPALLECSPATVINALFQCASMGLPLDGYHAHLIPFGKDATLIVDWKGYVAIAARYGIKAKATLVHENDEFSLSEDDGTGKTVVRHSWDIRKDRGPVVGAYSRAVQDNKDPDYEFIGVTEAFSIRDRSKGYQYAVRTGKSSPWMTDPGEMIKKTALRRHRKRWPIMSPELATADSIENDDFQAIEIVPPKFDALPEHVPQPEPPTAEPAKRGPGRPPKVAKPAEATPPTPEPPVDDLTSVRRLCSEAGAPEGVLVQYLRQCGMVDDTLMTLDDIAKVSPETLTSVRGAWDDMMRDAEWSKLVNGQEGGSK